MGLFDSTDIELEKTPESGEADLSLEAPAEKEFLSNYLYFRHMLTTLDLLGVSLQNLEVLLKAPKTPEASKVLSLLMDEKDLLEIVERFSRTVEDYRTVVESGLKGAAAIELQKNLQELRS